ncbi:MAG: hypothetical protein ACPG49_11865 [Chitinophagales bacterium]
MKEEAGTGKNTITEKLAADVQKYIELRLKFYKLDGLEKTASASAFSLALAIIIMLLTSLVFFLNILGAVMIAEYYDSWTIGFSALILFYVVLTILCIIFWKRFYNLFFNFFLSFMMNPKDLEDE